MRNMLDELEFDPERLIILNRDLNEIKQLKRKYGATVEDILEYAAKIEEEIDQIENRDSHLASFKKDLTQSARMWR
jgi:DNA repair protein RecN (Recombination protein N)